MSLRLAFLYPILAVVLFWWWSNQGELGGQIFLPDTPSGWVRTGFLGVLIVISVFSVVAMKNFALLTGRLGRNAVPTHQIASIILGCLFVIIELILNAVVPFIILKFVDISGAVAAVAVGVAFSVGVVVAVAVTELFDQTFFIRQHGPSGFYTIYLLFLGVLPVLNAGTDFLSVGVTRGFLRRVAQKKPCFWMILTQALCDLLVRFVCLALLLALLVAALDLWQWTGLWLEFNWRAYWADIQTNGWDQGGGLLLVMVFSTLLPTLIHLAFGVSAVLLSHSFLLRRATDILCATQALSRVGLNVAQHNQCVGLIWRGRGIACVTIGLVMVLIAGGLVVLTVLWWINWRGLWGGLHSFCPVTAIKHWDLVVG